MIEVIPTVIPRDLHELSERLAEYTNFTHTVHLDVNDGIFTEHVSWPFGVGQVQELGVLADHHGMLPKADTVAYDVHMMAHDPRELGLEFVRVGARRIIAHVEAFDDTEATRGALDMWKDAGAHEVGIAVLMPTPMELVEAVMPSANFVQFMSIASIGAHGSPFDERVLPRIREFHEKHPKVPIAVDGGINEKNIGELVKAGATRFNVGSAILKDFNSFRAYETLLNAARAVQ